MLGASPYRLSLVLVVFAAHACGGCAAGNQSPTGTEGGGGDSTTTSSATTETTSSSGGGGTTSTTSSGGTTSETGTGGATNTTSTGGTTSETSTGGGGTGGATGGGGAAPTETALAFAPSASSVLGADYHPDGAWNASSFGAGSSHAPAAALLDEANGVGLYRSPADGSLMFVKYSDGVFSAPLAIGMLAKSADAPSMVAYAGGAAAAYHGPDFKHYFAMYQGPMSGWSPAAEPILANAIHSFGPSAPAIAIVNGDVVIAYAGDNGNLYDQTRSGGVWAGANGHGVDGTVDLTPAIIEIPIGATEAMIAYVRNSDTQIMFTVRDAVGWTAPAAVPDAFTNDPPALASAFGNGAVLAFRGTNGMLYTCVYTPGNDPAWSLPKSFGSSTSASPALAPGIGGADAEMVFVTGGEVKHARLSAGAWSAAAAVGGMNATGVALATFSP